MTMSARQLRQLEDIESELELSQPQLTAMFDMFSELTSGERPSGAEPLTRRRWKWAPAASGWPHVPHRPEILGLLILVVAVTLGVLFGGGTRSVPSQCLAASTQSQPSSSMPAIPGARGTLRASYRRGGGGDLPVEDLGHEATELLSLVSIGEGRSLSRLAALAAGQVPGCSGAHATVWRAGELVNSAATHPDLVALADLEREAGGGPLTTAVREGREVYCPDTLEEERWPRWAAEALSRGVRCSAHLVRPFPPMTLVLALSGVRPAGLDAGAVPIAEMLAGFGSAALANTMAYGEAQRTATELRDAVVARAVTDQAKGILMHALNCSAEQALQFMRRESQQRHIKVTDVAARVIAAYSSQGDAAPLRPPRGPRRLAISPDTSRIKDMTASCLRGCCSPWPGCPPRRG